MANALKCDRCGSYFDYSPDTENFIAFGHKNITVSRDLPVKDICPNCMELFMKWLENSDNWKPEDSLAYIGNDTDCTDRSNGATKKELELTSELNDAKIYIAQLKSELGYTMTKEEIELAGDNLKYKDPCKSCYNGKCEQCNYGYCSEEEKRKRWLESHKKEEEK